MRVIHTAINGMHVVRGLMGVEGVWQGELRIAWISLAISVL